MLNSSSRLVPLLSVALLALAGAAACDSDGSMRPAPPAPPPPAPPPAPTSFSEFVRDQFAGTADDTDPVEVDERPLAFDNLDNPDAFDDLLP